MYTTITVQFLQFNFAPVRVFLRDGETVRDALRRREDAGIIDGFITESGEFQEI